MADPAAIADAILAACDALTVGTPTLTKAMPDVAFTPPVNGSGAPLPYLRVDLLTNAPLAEGLASGKLDQGILQITVVWPKGQGIIKAAETARDVMAAFPKGRIIYAAGVRVKIHKEPWKASPIYGDTTTDTPITIPWTA